MRSCSVMKDNNKHPSCALHYTLRREIVLQIKQLSPFYLPRPTVEWEIYSSTWLTVYMS